MSIYMERRLPDLSTYIRHVRVTAHNNYQDHCAWLDHDVLMLTTIGAWIVDWRMAA